VKTAWLRVTIFSACALIATSSSADTVSHSYDALGRLTSVCTAAPNDGEWTTYQYDAAGNRKAYSNAKVDIRLPAETAIFSPNGKFQFRMQADGNLVAYGDFGSGFTPLGWATNTVGSGATIAYFQSDGNLVLYTATGTPVWHSDTWTHHCSTLTVQNDGNVVIRNSQGVIVWATNTGGH
jgi:YD repeat-containing protein